MIWRPRTRVSPTAPVGANLGEVGYGGAALFSPRPVDMHPAPRTSTNFDISSEGIMLASTDTA